MHQTWQTRLVSTRTYSSLKQPETSIDFQSFIYVPLLVCAFCCQLVSEMNAKLLANVQSLKAHRVALLVSFVSFLHRNVIKHDLIMTSAWLFFCPIGIVFVAYYVKDIRQWFSHGHVSGTLTFLSQNVNLLILMLICKCKY